MLQMRNMCGNKDLTPYNAILQMRTNGKAEGKVVQAQSGHHAQQREVHG